MDILTVSHHVTRLDVVNMGRHRRWSEEAKLRIVDESYSGARQASATACRHGISWQQIFSWRKAYREGGYGGSGPVRAHATKKRSAAPGGLHSAGFAPALLVPDACSDGVRTAEARVGSMEIVTTNGRRVIAGSDVDVTALIRVVQGLEGLR